MSNKQSNGGKAEFSTDSKQNSDWELVARKPKKGSPALSSKYMASSSSMSANARPWNPSAVPKFWNSSAPTNTKTNWGSFSGVAAKARPWGPSNAKPMAWDNKDSNRGRRRNSFESWKTNTPNHSRAAQSINATPSPAVAPPLQNGWQWLAKASTSSPSKMAEEGSEYQADSESFIAQSAISFEGSNDDADSNDDDDADYIDDDDDDDYLQDSDFDSDASEKSLKMRKNHKMFKSFFEELDSLTEEEITNPDKEWHCPACKGGAGAIDWYKGLPALYTHAKTRGTLRVKLHREFAELLEVELQRRGGSVFPSGEILGKWKGLRDTVADKDVVWPPMVVVRNTVFEKDENEKWIGMGNQELRECFNSYAAKKARHSYGPNGHRGISILIFDTSPMGYIEAEHLHKQFIDEGRDRDAWIQNKMLFFPGGKRILYGYQATKEDLEIFNQHSSGKSRLKFEIKSYLEMVVNPLRKMEEDNQKIMRYKNKLVKGEKRCKTMEESLEKVAQKQKETEQDNRILRLRTKMQQEENKEAMDYQEQFFKEQMEKIQSAIEEKEKEFEKKLQQERAKAKQFVTTEFPEGEGHKRREEEINNFICGREGETTQKA